MLLKRFQIALFFYSLSLSIGATDLVLSTLAGGGNTDGISLDWSGGAYQGDSQAATAALLNYPQGICSDAQGQIYIADTRNNRIRLLDAQGHINSIAGTGAAGYNGDNIPATQAQLAHPQGVVYHDGKLYIADSNNDRIRMIDAAGMIHSIAGTGQRGYRGDGGLATQAQLSAPATIAIDSRGQIYFADRNNNVIRRIDTQGMISTFAGGSILAEDAGIGDGNLATQAQLALPGEITFDASDNLYIADMANNRIRVVLAANQQIFSIAGAGYLGLFQSRSDGDGGLASRAQISLPYGLSWDNGNLYFSSLNKDTIRKIDSAGIISTVAGNGYTGYNGDGAIANNAQLYSIYGLSQTPDGKLLIADSGNHRIRLLAENQPPIAQIQASSHYGLAPLHLRLDGHLSTDTEAPIASFQWHNAALGNFADSAVTELNLTEAGIHRFELTVTDRAGAQQQSYVDVKVRANQAPHAAFSWQNTGANLYADASLSSDPDGDALHFRWFLADSFAHQGTQLSLQSLQAGDYPLMLKVSDAYGAIDTVLQHIHFDSAAHLDVNIDKPPVARFNARLQTQDDQLWVYLDASASTDDHDGLSYAWQSSNQQLAEGEQAILSLPLNHVHHISLTVTDSSGQQDQHTQAIYTNDACIGTGAYGLDNRILQLPILRIVGDISEQAFQVTLKKMPEQNDFIIEKIVPMIGIATTQSPCQAWYHENGALNLPQVDVADAQTIQAVSADLHYDASTAQLNLEQIEPVSSHHQRK